MNDGNLMNFHNVLTIPDIVYVWHHPPRESEHNQFVIVFPCWLFDLLQCYQKYSYELKSNRNSWFFFIHRCFDLSVFSARSHLTGSVRSSRLFILRIKSASLQNVYLRWRNTSLMRQVACFGFSHFILCDTNGFIARLYT